MQLYLAFLDNLRGSERNIKQLTEDELTELIGISETPNGGSAAGWASNALCFHYSICREATATEAPELIAEGSSEIIESPNAVVNASKSYRIVPNPTSDDAQLISINSEVETKSLTIYDVNGRRVLDQSGSNHQRFNTSGLPNGIYFCRIVALDGSTENVKFIVNH